MSVASLEIEEVPKKSHEGVPEVALQGVPEEEAQRLRDYHKLSSRGRRSISQVFLIYSNYYLEPPFRSALLAPYRQRFSAPMRAVTRSDAGIQLLPSYNLIRLRLHSHHHLLF